MWRRERRREVGLSEVINRERRKGRQKQVINRDREGEIDPHSWT